jgi:chemotaxis-related protein WspD
VSAAVRPGDPFCWRAIGVEGDASCPELAAAVHCRNCVHFTAAGRALFERRAPEGYLEEWSGVLAEAKPGAAAATLSGLLFRLGTEWMAIDTAKLVEIAEDRIPHRIPHRTGLVAGLVNLRGQLHLCVSLHRLFGIPEPAGRGAAVAATGGPRSRLVVARDGDRTWAFAAEEVQGVHRFAEDSLSAVPLTVAEAQRRFTRGLFEHESRWVAWLDVEALFAALGAPS